MKKLVSSKKSNKAAQGSVHQAGAAAKTVDKAAVNPLAKATAPNKISTSSKKPPKPKKIRKEELSLSVTQAFRKQFKQAAKEAGYKKSDFLRILLLHWEERQQKPPSGARL